MVICDIVTGIQ